MKNIGEIVERTRGFVKPFNAPNIEITGNPRNASPLLLGQCYCYIKWLRAKAEASSTEMSFVRATCWTE